MFGIFRVLFFVLLLRSIKQRPPTVAGTQGYTLRNAWGVTKIILGRCLKESPVPDDYSAIPSLIRECLLRRSILVLDRLRTIDHLRICDGVDLVRYRNDSEILVNRQGDSRSHIGKADWGNQVIEKLDSILRTRLLKIQMRPQALAPITESRRRRRGGFNQMYPLILFGTMAMTLIAIPLGFQFLAVLGGKALLLAKLALILTSIQGLKKIATSNLNYGLYHANPSNSWHYDRSWYNDLKDERQEVDVGGPGQDLLRPLSSLTWSERIK